MNPYFEQTILTASPVELIRIIYSETASAITEARGHLAEGRIRERTRAINRAYALVAELLTALDEERSPELCGKLRPLYCYVQERLIEGNIRQSDGPLAEAAGLIGTLGEAWRAVPDLAYAG